MASENLSAPDLWAQTVDLIKDRVNSRSLWLTMEKAVGITIENDTLIVGLNARIFNEAGHLSVSEHRNAIERAVRELSGEPLAIRVIEGDSLDDWIFTKKRDERVAAMRTAGFEKRDREEAESQSWDALYDYVSRTYSGLHLRTLPQKKARYLTDMLYVIADAMDNLYPEQADDSADRHLARVLEKVAGNADIPATLVALEIERLRAWRKQSE